MELKGSAKEWLRAAVCSFGRRHLPGRRVEGGPQGRRWGRGSRDAVDDGAGAPPGTIDK